MHAINVKPAKDQGRDSIVIEAPQALVWELISNSKALEDWGPPVREVSVLDHPEVLGSRRIIVAEMTAGGAAIERNESATATGKRVARFLERRIEHVEGRKLSYRIEEENMGMSRMITEVGFAMELFPLEANRTRVEWTFLHNTRGLLGALVNPLFIRPQQRKNRLAALAALKSHAENLHATGGQVGDGL
jgi:hypothetical protein